MKKNVLLLAALICMVALHAQDPHKVFSSPTIGWYGFDFRNAKMIGFGDESPHKIKDEYFKAWGDVTIDLDLAKVFKKNSAIKDPGGLLKLNMARETGSLKADEAVEFSREKIDEIAQTIPTGLKKDGLAVSFIVESFNKTTGIATVHVTFIDIATHKVLWTKKLTGKAGGGDLKKSWSTALKDIFTQIEKKEFDNWRKEANY